MDATTSRQESWPCTSRHNLSLNWYQRHIRCVCRNGVKKICVSSEQRISPQGHIAPLDWLRERRGGGASCEHTGAVQGNCALRRHSAGHTPLQNCARERGGGSRSFQNRKNPRSAQGPFRISDARKDQELHR